MVFLLFVLCYLGLKALICHSRGELVTLSKIYGMDFLEEGALHLARKLLAGVKYFFIMEKVVVLTFLVVIVIFPLLCGW